MKAEQDINDTIETLVGTKIQHGKLSNRIYVMELDETDCPGILDALDALAIKNGYTKIFAKVPQISKRYFGTNGYVVEAKIPAFFSPTIDGYFMGKYFQEERRIAKQAGKILDAREKAKERVEKKSVIDELPAHYQMRICKEADATDMAELYSIVFDSYPFPIFDPNYLIKTMRDNILYFGVWENEMLVALSSCEMDDDHKNVEMTDFSTRPDSRGNGLAKRLLAEMDRTMRRRGFRVAYTIARAASMPMNLVFGDNQYAFAGTLVNNTNIGGSIESMHVWWKHL